MQAKTPQFLALPTTMPPLFHLNHLESGVHNRYNNLNMYDDDTLAAEKFGEYRKKPGERLDENGEAVENPEAAEWTSAMSGESGEPVPPFAGEWGYGPVPGVPESATVPESALSPGGANPSELDASLNPELAETDDLSGANQLTSYGLDTAARVYGFNTVVQTILETDETGRDAENPLGEIYRRLAPDPREREYLYREIRKEQVRNNQYNTDPALSDAEDPRIGFTRYGDFYDKTIRDAGSEQASVNAIRALRRLIEMLETSERFADVRARAAERGKTIVEYLVSDEDNPTLTDFFNRVGAEMSEDEAEEVVAELEEQVNPDFEEEQVNSDFKEDQANSDSKSVQPTIIDEPVEINGEF